MELATNASLDWSVVECPVSVTLPDGGQRELSNCKALVRGDNNAHLSIVSKAYEVVQNSVLTNLVQPLISEGLLEVKNTGYLKGGRSVFIQAQMTEEFKIADEPHRGMLTLLNSHDGSTQLSAGVTDVRVICENTFAMAYSEMSTRLRHKMGVNERALGITETINYVNDRMRQFQQAAEVLASTKATMSQVEQVIRAAYNKKAEETVRHRDEIVGLYHNGTGNGEGTLYDVFNAITEYNTHRSKKETDKRFAYSNFGTGAYVARRAIDAALALA